jgi:hypothetical protein
MRDSRGGSSRVGPQHLAPEPLHHRRFRVEAVAAEVEAEALVVLCARQPADRFSALEDERGRPARASVSAAVRPAGPAPSTTTAPSPEVLLTLNRRCAGSLALSENGGPSERLDASNAPKDTREISARVERPRSQESTLENRVGDRLAHGLVAFAFK